MRKQRLRWLLDVGVPGPEAADLDVALLTDIVIHRGRGDNLEVANALGRVLVSMDRGYLGRVIEEHMGIVVIEGERCTSHDVARNLRHFQFCINHCREAESLGGQRFLLKMDRSVFQLRPDGVFRELETWKLPQLESAPYVAEVALPFGRR